MLDFDPAASALLYDGVVIAPRTEAVGLCRGLNGTLRSLAGRPGWTQIETQRSPLRLSITFRDGLVHSGYLWAAVAHEGGWAQIETIEAARRRAHEAIMTGLFGTDRFDDGRINIALVRDPRSYLEQIAFRFTAA